MVHDQFFPASVVEADCIRVGITTLPKFRPSIGARDSRVGFRNSLPFNLSGI